MILEAKNITKSFGEKQILSDVSIELNKGEIVSLLGVSGCGKTTLFNIISGLIPADSGRIILDGEEITGQAGKVSYMLQKDLLLPYYTVAHNIALPLIIKNGMKKREAVEKARSYFDLFGLSGTEDKYPAQLSGGMKQRAAFLRTYLSSDGVALLDEPFSALDTITKNAIHRWYLHVMEEIKLSTVFVTHDIDEAIFLSDRIYILAGRPGKITREFKIEHPEKGREHFELTDEFLEHKRNIIEALGQI